MPEVHHTQARAQTRYQSQKEGEQGAGAVTELFHLRMAQLAAVGLSKAGHGCIFPSGIRLYTKSINHAGACRSEFLAGTLLSSWT